MGAHAQPFPSASPGAVARREPLIPSGVLGMLIFIFSETMLFAGFISGFMIVESEAAAGAWPPPWQPRLPVEQTLFNTAVLLLSGVALIVAHRRFGRDSSAAKLPMLAALGLGVTFVALQGVEWVALIGEGLTLTVSTHSSFFYVIVGAHGLHALAAIGALAWAYAQLRQDRLPATALWTCEVLWYFVVLVWPILYWKVYL